MQVFCFALTIPCRIFGRPEIPVDHDHHHYDSLGPIVPVPSTEFLPAVKLPQQFHSSPQESFEPSNDYNPPKEYGPPPGPIYGLPPKYGPPPTLQQIITKNLYVHLPPPETEEPQPQPQVFEPTVPKKHYKIIFIKAPTPPTPVAPKLPQQIPDEHKTLVYVLVQKPESQPQIEIPKAPPTPPSKPEVYFIKYKDGDKKPHTAYGPPPGPY